MIALVRHPPVAATGRCYGRLDLPVADMAEVDSLVTRLAPFGGTIWTSPARRCRAVAEALGVYRVDERLQELAFGLWEGRPWDDVPRDGLDAWAADPWGFAPPGGETGRALVARVCAFAGECAVGTHVVITHGGPLKVLVPLLLGDEIDLLAPPPATASVTLIGSGRA